VVVDKPDIKRAGALPAEDDTPLIVDSNTVKPIKIATQCLEAIAWRTTKVLQNLGRIEEIQLPNRDSAEMRAKPTATATTVVESVRCPVTKRTNHSYPQTAS